MITKSLICPTNPLTNDKWLSPDGHAPSWARAWNGTDWVTITEENSNVGSNTSTLSDSNGQQESDGQASGETDGSQSEGGEGEQPEGDA